MQIDIVPMTEGDWKDAAIDDAFLNDFFALHSLVIRDNTMSLAPRKKCGLRTVGFWESPVQTEDGMDHDVVLLEYRRDSVYR